MKAGRLERAITAFGGYAGLALFVIVSVFPVFWLVSSSIRPYLDVLTFPPRIFPTRLSLASYVYVLTRTSFLQLMMNSLIVAVTSSALSVGAATLAGYSLARMKFRGKHLISRGILVAYMFPQIVLIVPLFVGLATLGLNDTRLGLTLTHVTFSFPFSVWLLVAYFQTIPADMEECAKIDGASNFTAFFRITLPLAAPGIATALIFSFNLSWREFLYAFVIISDADLRTLPIGLYNFIGGEYVEWPELLSMSALVALPTVAFFLAIQRHIVGGLTGGALKG